jgi:RNA polymerase sigma factor (sigma-70 family)
MSSNAKTQSRIALLFGQYRADLHRFFGRSLDRYADADDLIQDTFLNMWKAESRGALEGDLRGYLFTTAKNLAHNARRHNRARHLNDHVSLSEKIDELCSTESEKALFEREGVRLLENALSALKPHTRTVFVMYYVEGRTIAEIANVLRISTRSVERHVANALRHCHDALGPLLRDLLD